jgi:hypothetical protein
VLNTSGNETLYGFVDIDGVFRFTETTPASPVPESSYTRLRFINRNTLEYQIIETKSDATTNFASYVILKRVDQCGLCEYYSEKH